MDQPDHSHTVHGLIEDFIRPLFQMPVVNGLKLEKFRK